MPGTISYFLTERDVVAARQVQYVRRAISLRSLGHNAIALLVLWFIAFSLIFVDRESIAADALSATIFAAAALFPAALLIALGYYRAGQDGRRAFRQQRTLREESQTTWSDEGLEVRTASVAVSMCWSDYESWRPEAVGYLIYLSDYSGHLLPRRSFTDEQWNDLGATLVRNKVRRRGSAREVDQPAQLRGVKDRAAGRHWWRGPWSRPGRVALLWMILTILIIAATVVSPTEDAGIVSGTLFLSGTPVLAALLAGWALRLRSSTLGLAAAFLAVAILFEGVLILSKFSQAARLGDLLLWLLATLMVLTVIVSLWLGFSHRSGPRRVAAIVLVLCVFASAVGLSRADRLFWRASSEARTLLHLNSKEDEERSANAMPDIPVDRLWEAQQGLLGKAVDGLPSRVPGHANVYAMAVAAAGTQQLFSREARLALRVAAARFGGDYRGGVLLSNGVAEILRSPLATQTNIAAAARGVGARTDPAADFAFVYLASHGSPDAELSTNLPSYEELTPISAVSVNEALERAGIRRRVVIVSACYSGSWIPALANDDTIVITAARKDRTSFGCDDTRRLTYFGQAFLEGPLARGASLRDAFEEARKTVGRWELSDHLTSSEPQAYVGKHMQALWTERGSSWEQGHEKR
ncbi:MAG: C13 family peptidase [Sphingomonas sp.]